MLKKAKSAVSIVLAVMMVISCFAFADFSVSAEEYKTVYFNNNEGWDEVYCFIWNNTGSNAKWRRKLELIGDNVWSYNKPTPQTSSLLGAAVGQPDRRFSSSRRYTYTTAQ